MPLAESSWQLSPNRVGSGRLYLVAVPYGAEPKNEDPRRVLRLFLMSSGCRSAGGGTSDLE